MLPTTFRTSNAVSEKGRWSIRGKDFKASAGHLLWSLIGLLPLNPWQALWKLRDES